MHKFSSFPLRRDIFGEGKKKRSIPTRKITFNPPRELSLRIFCIITFHKRKTKRGTNLWNGEVGLAKGQGLLASN